MVAKSAKNDKAVCFLLGHMDKIRDMIRAALM